MADRVETIAEGVTLKRLRAKERMRRYRMRMKGEDAPFAPLGPKLGFRQSSEHIEKRKRCGEHHYGWKGDAVSPKGGRTRALRMYPESSACSACGAARSERHHADANTANNNPNNIKFLCRRCHMAEDGRLLRFNPHAR